MALSMFFVKVKMILGNGFSNLNGGARPAGESSSVHGVASSHGTWFEPQHLLALVGIVKFAAAAPNLQAWCPHGAFF